MKQCAKCKQWKDEEEFSWRFRGLGIRHSRCQDCRKVDQAVYYQRTKQDRVEYKANCQIETREEAWHYVYTHLKSHPCVDCGETDPLVLTLDHVRGRKFMNVSQMVNQGYILDFLITNPKSYICTTDRNINQFPGCSTV